MILILFLFSTSTTNATDNISLPKRSNLTAKESNSFNNTDGWATSPNATNCRIQSQPNSPSPEGGNNLWYFSAKANTCRASHQLNQPLKEGVIDIWFYDNGDLQNNPLSVMFYAVDKKGTKVSLGAQQNLDAGTQMYYMDLLNGRKKTYRNRSAGWHLFSIYRQNGNTYVAIDGKQSKHSAYTSALGDITEIGLESNDPAVNQAIRIDGLKVYHGPTSTTQHSVDIKSNSASNGYLAAITSTYTTDTDLSLPENFRNLGISISDVFPQISAVDNRPMFFTERSGNSYNFGSFSWKGADPLKLGNPNINVPFSYELVKRSSGQLCLTTGRKVVTSRTSDAYACVNTTQSSVQVQQDKVTVIWELWFRNDFINVRREKRAITPTNVLESDFNVFSFANTTFSEYLQYEHILLKNRWQLDNQFVLPNPNVVSKSLVTGASSTITNQNGPNATINVTVPNLAQRSKVVIWLSETDPEHWHADISPSYQLEKSENDWKIGGISLTNSAQCNFNGVEKRNEFCSESYSYSQNMQVLGSATALYHNLSRTTSLTPAQDTVAGLDVSRAKVNGNVISLPLKFFDRNGLRELNIYVAVEDSQNRLSGWKNSGQLTIAKQRQVVKPSKLVVSSDGKWYLNADTNKKFVHTGVNKPYIYNEYSPTQLKAYFAKMNLYRQNAIRVFSVSENPNILAKENFMAIAEDYDIYLNPIIYHPADRSYMRDLVLRDQGETVLAPLKHLVKWFDTSIEKYDAVLIWDYMNEPSSEYRKFIDFHKQAMTYIQQHDSNRLLMAQPNTSSVVTPTNQTNHPIVKGDHYNMMPLEMAVLTDGYSFRDYKDQIQNPQTSTIEQRIDFTNQYVQQRRPYYFGEYRIRNYFDSHTSQAIVDQTKYIVDIAINDEFASVFPWVSLQRKEYAIASNAIWFWPLLDKDEWVELHRFVQHHEPISYDLNSQKIVPLTPTTTNIPTQTATITASPTPDPERWYKKYLQESTAFSSIYALAQAVSNLVLNL